MNPLLAAEMARQHREELLAEAERDRLVMEATRDRPGALERIFDSLSGLARALRHRGHEQAGGVVPHGTLGAFQPPLSPSSGAPLGIAGPNTVPLLRP